jgi:hypothetical protein
MAPGNTNLGVTVVFSGVRVVLQWFNSDVKVALQWRYSGVTVVSQGARTGAPSMIRVSRWHYCARGNSGTQSALSCWAAPDGVGVVLQWCYSGVTVVLQWCYSGV